MTPDSQGTEHFNHGLVKIGHQNVSRYNETSIESMSDVFRCRWTHTVISGSNTQQVLVIPDNCADFIASDSGHCWFVGPATTVDLPNLQPGTTLHGLRIQPHALQAVIDADPAELTDRRAKFNDVLPSRVARLLGDALMSNGLNDRTLGQLWPRTSLDSRTSRGIDMLLLLTDSSIDNIANDCTMSPRQFRRLIKQVSGLTPKTLQRVSRLHHALDIARNLSERSLSMIATTAGFTDQSHLARDVRKLANLTPQQFFQEHL